VAWGATMCGNDAPCLVAAKQIGAAVRWLAPISIVGEAQSLPLWSLTMKHTPSSAPIQGDGKWRVLSPGYPRRR